MSLESALRSSSSRSMRSTKLLSRSPAIPPTSGIGGSMLVLLGGEAGLLIGARLPLVLAAPFVVRHAVDDLARLRVAELDALFPGGGAVPFRQAIAAEPGEVHQVDVLHVGTLAQVLDEGAERRGFEFGAGLVVDLLVHGGSSPMLGFM